MALSRPLKTHRATCETPCPYTSWSVTTTSSRLSCASQRAIHVSEPCGCSRCNSAQSRSSQDHLHEGSALASSGAFFLLLCRRFFATGSLRCGLCCGLCRKLFLLALHSGLGSGGRSLPLCLGSFAAQLRFLRPLEPLRVRLLHIALHSAKQTCHKTQWVGIS